MSPVEGTVVRVLFQRQLYTTLAALTPSYLYRACLDRACQSVERAIYDRACGIAALLRKQVRQGLLPPAVGPSL